MLEIPIDELRHGIHYGMAKILQQTFSPIGITVAQEPHCHERVHTPAAWT